MNDIQKKRLVTDVLIKMGADPANNGFYILRDAVLSYMGYDLPASVRQQDVFAPIGEKYGVNGEAAYSNVRHLIGNIMTCGDIEFLENYFGRCYRADKGTVKPKAFIIRIADDIKMQCEEFSKKGGVIND